MQVAMSRAAGSSEANTDEDAIPLPATILAAVEERLTELDPSPLLIVSAAAVIGQGFSLQEVATVAACSLEVALAGLDAVRPSRLIVEVPALSTASRSGMGCFVRRSMN